MPGIATRSRRIAFAALVTSFVLAAGALRMGGVGAQGDTRDLAQRLERLDAGVRAEEGVRAIKRLQNTYSQYLEWGLWTEAADLFSDTVVAQFGETSVTGKENLRKYLMTQAGTTSEGLKDGQLNTHLVLQPIITLGSDGKTGKGAWHEVDMLGQFGAKASWAGGIYENEYALENGVWKISTLHFYPQYEGAYEEYGHRAPAKWNIPYHFEAAHVGVTIPQSAFAQADAKKGTAPAEAASLQKRVQRLNEETAVQNLQHSYGYYLDRKLWDDVADLFTDDGTFEVANRGTYAGKAHIRRALEVLYGPSPLKRGELFDHINLSTVATVAGNGQTAGVRTLQLSQLGLINDFARWEIGTYENEFVKQNGVWKIKALHYYPRLQTDFNKGWQVDAKPAPDVSADLAPDRKPSQLYASYPKVQPVGFHYVHPVTHRAVSLSGAAVKVTVVNEKPTDSGKSDGASATVIASAERGLAMAIGVDAVENLNSSYGYYIDESAWDNMADTYSLTRGGKEITGAGMYLGQERIRKILKLRGPNTGRTANFFTIHQLTQPVIHVAEDGQSAKARLRLFQLGGNADGSSGSWIGGIYENTAFFENGEWKFGIQDLHHIFNAAYDVGWARLPAAGGRATAAPAAGQRAAAPPAAGARAAGAATASAAPAGRAARGGGIQQGLGGAASATSFREQMPPDRPIRARQYAFPDIDEPSFHYKNPVSDRMPKDLLP